MALDCALLVIRSAQADPFIKAKCAALMKGYHARYFERMSAAKILAVEKEFRFELRNPETGAPSRTFDEAGKLDLLMEENGQIKVQDHKFVSDSLAPDSDFWDCLKMDTQVSKYHMAAEVLGFRAEVSVRDAIRRPMLKATDVPILDGDDVAMVFDMFGNRVRTKDGKKWKQRVTEDGEILQTRPMTPEEYETKLDNDIAERPEFYFAQREVARLDSEILEYMKDAWVCSQQILAWRRMDAWPRNPNACGDYGGCRFLQLCAGRAEVDGFNYRERVGPRHPELSEDCQTNGRELLTQSRMNALRRCARLHHHLYENPIERVKEESEALQVGTLMHQALEAWFKEIQASQK